MGCLGVSRTRCERNRVGSERRPDDAGVAAGRAAVAILLALTIPASAQDTTTANQMLPGCKGLLDNSMTSGVSVYQQGRCGGYVASLVYGGGQEFCRPNGATIGQSVAVVIKYIEARPERMHEDFGKLAIEAMTAAWPCKR
jgi:Rap1a immunity proteins